MTQNTTKKPSTKIQYVTMSKNAKKKQKKNDEDYGKNNYKKRLKKTKKGETICNEKSAK